MSEQEEAAVSSKMEREKETCTSSVPDAVRKIVSTLEAAQTDTERLAALFLVTKAVRAEELDAHSQRIIFDAVGFSFLSRLLRAEASPNPETATPPVLYKSVALSILTCFCTDPELVVHPQMLANIPVLLGIVADADAEVYQDDLTVVSEAYQCLQWIARRWRGAQALLRCEAPAMLVDIYLAQSFKCEEAMAILVTLAARCADNMWISDPAAATRLLNKLSLEFEADNGEHKFELCRSLSVILASYPRYDTASADNPAWPRGVRRALFDIFRSKVTKKERDPALHLAAHMLDLLGVSWAIDDQAGTTFMLLLAQLSCVEVRMGLSAPNIDEEVLAACYLVMENIIGCLVTGQAPELEAKHRDQLYCALKGAYGVLLQYLVDISEVKCAIPEVQQPFLCASVRCLAAWLAEETAASRSEIIKLIPFLVKLGTETFEAGRWSKVAVASRKVRFQQPGDAEFPEEDEDDEEEDGLASPQRPPDLLRFLLPGFCHLTSEDKGRSVLLTAGLDDILLQYTSHLWMTYIDRKRPPRARRRSKVLEASLGAVHSARDLQLAEEELSIARTSLVTTLNIFLNLAVLEPQRVASSSVYRQLLRFIFSIVPELAQMPPLGNGSKDIVLYATTAVTGLMLLKQQIRQGDSDPDIPTSFLQPVVRFLWDAYEVEEEDNNPDAGHLNISREYRQHWSDIVELWFLGLQCLGALLETVPWLPEFLLDSGFARSVLKLLERTKAGFVDKGTLTAYESFLCQLVRSSTAAAAFAHDHGCLVISQTHSLKNLTKALLDD